MSSSAQEIRSSFDALIGTEWLDKDPDHARVRVPVSDKLRQPFGLLHGGVISTLVESVCAWATTLAVVEEGMMALGQAISINFIRPITEGAVEVRAMARHRGRTTWVWDAEIYNDEDQLCALGRMTMAIRPLPDQV
jgi:1,4-dihydroxy-2-naphthoyl-CoA hydrolase